MKRNVWSLIAGFLLIGLIFWIAWATMSGPMMLGGFSAEFVPAPKGVESSMSMDQALDAVVAYLDRLDDENLTLSELMQFDNHFYAAIKERDTGMYAFELLVDPINGQVVPEPGPNMMWNNKYGHMKMGFMQQFFGQDQAGNDMGIGPEQAIQIAQQYLDQILSGTQVAEQAERFNGYYTLHTLKGDNPIGMLSVNGHDGRVWVHSWHGAFLDMRK